MKYAILIGINYISDPLNKLSGCVDDITLIQKLLISDYGYNSENTYFMVESSKNLDLIPTKQNILNQINKIIPIIKSGDILIFYYSGHGSQIPDTSNSEKNNPDTPGYDDCICPCDFSKYPNQTGFITDLELKKLLVDRIPKGAKLRAFFDACHSGTILDLEFVWLQNSEFFQEYKPDKLSDDVLSISGCRDNQTSADSWNKQNRMAMGALTMMLIKVLKNTKKIKTTWKELLIVTRHYLIDSNYGQLPILSVANKKLADSEIDL